MARPPSRPPCSEELNGSCCADQAVHRTEPGRAPARGRAAACRARHPRDLPEGLHRRPDGGDPALPGDRVRRHAGRRPRQGILLELLHTVLGPRVRAALRRARALRGRPDRAQPHLAHDEAGGGGDRAVEAALPDVRSSGRLRSHDRAVGGRARRPWSKGGRGADRQLAERIDARPTTRPQDLWLKRQEDHRNVPAPARAPRRSPFRLHAGAQPAHRSRRDRRDLSRNLGTQYPI